MINYYQKKNNTINITNTPPQLSALADKDIKHENKSENLTNSIPKIVRLNIGGKLFYTTPDTLRSRGDNFFTGLLSGRISSTKDENGAYFIDRNGDLFAPILDYLRSGELIIPKHIEVSQIENEAQFFSVDLPAIGEPDPTKTLYSTCYVLCEPDSDVGGFSWILYSGTGDSKQKKVLARSPDFEWHRLQTKYQIINDMVAKGWSVEWSDGPRLVGVQFKYTG